MDKQQKIDYITHALDERFEGWLKNHSALWTNLIQESRRFYDSVIALSVAISGVIIPIIFNSSAQINRPLLLFAAVVFLIEIIVGIFGRFFVIRRDIKVWPDELTKMEDNYKKSRVVIQSEGVNDTTLKKIEKIFATEQKPVFDFFKWIFMPLFIGGMVFLVFSFIWL